MVWTQLPYETHPEDGDERQLGNHELWLAWSFGAAALAYPERQIICLTGDGGLTMVLGDFLTPHKYNLPVKVFVVNNKSLGMIMQEKKVEGYKDLQTELQDYSFADFAEHSGGLGIKVSEPTDLEAAVDKALASDKPTIVDIDSDAKRFP